MKKQITLRSLGMLALGASLLVACSKDDKNAPVPPATSVVPQAKDAKMLLVVGQKNEVLKTGLAGGVSMKIISDYSKPQTMTVYKGEGATHAYEAFTQVSYNPQAKALLGFVYPGGAKTVDEQGQAQPKAPRIYTYNVDPAQGAISFVGKNDVGYIAMLGTLGSGWFGTAKLGAGAVQLLTKTAQGVSAVQNTNIDLDKLKKGEVTPSIANILDLGGGQAVVALSYTPQALSPKAGGPGRALRASDATAVSEFNALAFVDYNLNVKSTIESDKIGPSGAGWKGARYQHLATNDAGDLYVFSGSSSKIGALRIKKGAQSYDTSYLFEIGKASGGYGFRRVYHITGDYFLLECYNEVGKYANADPASKLAVINVSTKSFAWVTGLPTGDKLTTFAASNNGYIYVPVSPKSEADGIYRIDPKTAAATKIITLGSEDYGKAVTFVY